MNPAVDALAERPISEHCGLPPTAWRIMSAVAWRRGTPLLAAPTLIPGADR